MLTSTQIAEVFRMLGYPNKGTATPGNVGYPAFASALGIWQPFAVLENRLNTMTQDEEVMLFGAEHSAFGTYYQPAMMALTLSTPSTIATGAQLEVDLDQTLVSLSAAAGDTPITFAAKFAAAVNSDATAKQTFLASADASGVITFRARSMGVDGNGMGLQAVSNDASLLVSTGGAAAQYANSMTAGGANPPGPYIVLEGQAQPLYGYVPIVRILENDLGNTRNNLDMVSVGGAGGSSYVARPDELKGRKALMRHFRREMADHLNVPLDPDLLGNASRCIRRRV